MSLRITSISIPYDFSIATQGRYLYFLSPVISCQKYINIKKLATINDILYNIYREISEGRKKKKKLEVMSQNDER